jgi:hypothetical protein
LDHLSDLLLQTDKLKIIFFGLMEKLVSNGSADELYTGQINFRAVAVFRFLCNLLGTTPGVDGRVLYFINGAHWHSTNQ